MDWTTNKIQRLCRFCSNPATEWHHKFKNSDINREIYGSLLDEPFNLEPACNGCNGSHAHIPAWAIWDEQTFREAAEADGHELPEGTKSYQNKWG